METTHRKPHAVCIPIPGQGHINPMLKLAKLLHSSGFHITFVYTEFHYRKVLSSENNHHPDDSVNDFRFETISDGLPPENERGILDLEQWCIVMPKKGLVSFRDLIVKLNGRASSGPEVPPVTCIVSDILLSFTLEVAQEFGIPETLLATPSACATLGYLHFHELTGRGYFPLKDEECLTNGYLDTVIDWIPGMSGVRLRDFPFIKSTNPDDIMFNYNLQAAKKSFKAEAILLNSLHDLEQEVIDAIKAKYSPKNVFTIGPLSMLQKQLCSGSHLDSISSSLWKEDTRCLEWLDNKEPKSVVYVNYGSLVIMTPEQLGEFAWGLANSKYHFLWIIRPNLVKNWSEIITDEYMEEIKERSMLASWCPQEKVLEHPSIGVFLTHCGWNSTLESITEGVPMLCWPFFTDQQMNCFFACRKWGVGLEIDEDVRREKVEKLLQDVMEGEAGHQMRKKAGELKEKARIATRPNGISYTEFEKLVQHLKEPNSVVGSL